MENRFYIGNGYSISETGRIYHWSVLYSENLFEKGIEIHELFNQGMIVVIITTSNPKRQPIKICICEDELINANLTWESFVSALKNFLKKTSPKDNK